jgi:hypothetical protein
MYGVAEESLKRRLKLQTRVQANDDSDLSYHKICQLLSNIK